MRKKKLSPPPWAKWVAKDPDGWPCWYAKKPRWSSGAWSPTSPASQLSPCPYSDWSWLDRFWNARFGRIFSWNSNLFWTIASRFTLRRVGRRG